MGLDNQVGSSVRTSLHGPEEVALRQGRVVTRAQHPRTERLVRDMLLLSAHEVAFASCLGCLSRKAKPASQALASRRLTTVRLLAHTPLNAVARARTRSAARQTLRLALSRPPPPPGRRGGRQTSSYLVDPASSHMLVSKIKPCMSKYKPPHGETANGSLDQLWFLRSYNSTRITVAILELIRARKL